MLNKLKHKVKLWIYKIVPPPYCRESFSQAGEDQVINFLLSGIGITTPTYLELGVYEPITGSNTYFFYKNGSKGVLVEADTTLIENIKKHRPRDIVLNYGVGVTSEKDADFYVFEMPAHNTFNKEEAEYRAKNGSYKLAKIEKVKMLPINDILKSHFNGGCPHFLSIDIEGLDLDVLKTIDFSIYPIPIICAETCMYSENHIKSKDLSIEQFLKSKGYFVYADTYINTIFVNENWFNTAHKNS